MGVYDTVPKRLLTCLSSDGSKAPVTNSFCAGFELEEWRCDAFADHMIDWLPDYALKEDELDVSHCNMYVRLKEAAARVYKSKKYASRGEVGEITLHAICRDYFGTIPIAPRVFYLTSSNEVVKSFDMVHVRYPDVGIPELWLGEAKFYVDSTQAVNAAIASIETHIDRGFLNNEKLILGPQISKSTPRYNEVRELLSTQTSLDELFRTAVFPVCIACNSDGALAAKSFTSVYQASVVSELNALASRIEDSGLCQKLRIVLIYVPLKSKAQLATAFDLRLKGLSP